MYLVLTSMYNAGTADVMWVIYRVSKNQIITGECSRQRVGINKYVEEVEGQAGGGEKQ